MEVSAKQTNEESEEREREMRECAKGLEILTSPSTSHFLSRFYHSEDRLAPQSIAGASQTINRAADVMFPFQENTNEIQFQ